MSGQFARHPGLASRAYHDLFLGNDTDEAEAAAYHLARTVGLIADFLTSK